ncbi:MULTISPECIES: hypothetical protein [Shewanella]|uniref:hypothetical protein n=1 Tax=Shewanella TaxID=22 RepID=UPI001C65A5E7|nr:hypothetical protein [Shewanella zhangzhouensis]QYK03430.1 hypothetical protein K0H63_09820 [Shewanella zhangzhouensis]
MKIYVSFLLVLIGLLPPFCIAQGNLQQPKSMQNVEVSFTETDGQLSVLLYNQTALKK